jgi:catecholate siderophore receptor
MTHPDTSRTASDNAQTRRADGAGQALKLAALGMAVAGIAKGEPAPEAPAGAPVTTLPAVEVTGTVSALPQDVPQSIATVSHAEVTSQAVTRLEDALRNVPGITINAGEGGAHGDSLNLRGLSVPDSFFLDGVRDIGLYQRDTFDQQVVEVLLGPSSVLFGRGSTAGVINQVSKQPSLSPVDEVDAEAGSAGLVRATADLGWAFNGSTAARLNLMDERSGVVDRDHIENARNGFAPAIAFGIDKPATLTLSFLHQEENDLPDYGIPFIDGAPAQVDRSTYYGLTNYDRTKTQADIGTARLELKINDHLSIVDSLRYAHYSFDYFLSAPNLADDYTEVAPPGTPLGQILVYRDQPSSSGTESELIEHVDLTAKFDTGAVAHSLIAGIEVSREVSDVTRYLNGIDDLPPTTLINPASSFSPPTPLEPDDFPDSTGTDVSLDAMDSMHLGPKVDLDGGIRWDRFNSHFSEAASGSAYERDDTEVSPRASVVFKPAPGQSYYVSYGESYNPAIEYLTLAPSNDSLSPEKDYTTEVGTKLSILHGTLDVTGALFDTTLENARNADPDDPTVQEVPFSQRVQGLELGVSGYITPEWEIKAGYTLLRDRITGSGDPDAVGKQAPNVARDSLTSWLTYEPNRSWQIGAGARYTGHRFADTDNTAGVPGYEVFDAMVSYRVNEHLDLQVNVNNLADKLFYNGIYYTGPDENHTIPSAGRTVIVSARLKF